MKCQVLLVWRGRCTQSFLKQKRYKKMGTPAAHMWTHDGIYIQRYTFQICHLTNQMKSQVEEKFSSFFHKWVCEQEELLKNLIHASTDDAMEESHLQDLISKLTTHWKLYYTVKWAHAHHDVLAFFSPSWLTPLETTYCWFTGWKPSLLFKLIVNNDDDNNSALSADQLVKIHELRREIKDLEKKVEMGMERQQMSIACPQMVQLSKHHCTKNNAVEGLVDVAMKTLLVGLEKTMKSADCVRLKTLKGILEVLTPLQCVHFLVSFSLIQVRLRQEGRSKNVALWSCCPQTNNDILPHVTH